MRKPRSHIFGVVPKSLTKTDIPVLYACEDKEGEDIYTIYDANWKQIKEFTVQNAVSQGREIVKQREWVVVDSAIVSHSPIEVEENGMWTACPSLSAATKYAETNGYNIVRKQENGDVIFISEESPYFYMEEVFGKNYPTYILVYYSNRELNVPCFERCSVSYDAKAIGDWVIVSDDTQEHASYIVTCYRDLDDHTHVEFSDYYNSPSALFQNLFSTGGKYECFRPIYTMREVPDTVSKDRDYDGEIDQLTLCYSSDVSGIEVLADGNVIKSFDISPIVLKSLYVIKIAGCFYLETCTFDGGECYIYRIDSKQNSISLVKSITNTRMYPNVIRPGDAVTIDFGMGDTSVSGELIVTDAVGRVVERRPVPAGSGNLQIGTRRLRAGSYNFTVYRAGQLADNGKIIIR